MPSGPPDLNHSRANRRSRRQLARFVLALLAGLGVYLLYLLPYQDLPGWMEAVGARVADLGWYGPLLFALTTAVMTAIGVPRLLMTGVAAALFGLVWGLLSSQIGALIGAYAVFTLARWSGREVGLHRWRKLRRYSNLMSEHGVMPVLLIRQLPLSSFFINLLLGLSAVKTRDFFLGSLIGFLPEAIPAALIGAGLVQGSLGASLQYLLLGVVLFGGLLFLLRWLLRSPAASDERRRLGLDQD